MARLGTWRRRLGEAPPCIPPPCIPPPGFPPPGFLPTSASRPGTRRSGEPRLGSDGRPWAPSYCADCDGWLSPCEPSKSRPKTWLGVGLALGLGLGLGLGLANPNPNPNPNPNQLVHDRAARDAKAVDARQVALGTRAAHRRGQARRALHVRGGEHRRRRVGAVEVATEDDRVDARPHGVRVRVRVRVRARVRVRVRVRV